MTEKIFKTFEEEWKDVAGFENIYQVSNWGRIRRHFLTKGFKILSPMLNIDGYRQVCLSVKCTKKYFRVCRLVAQAFIKNPGNKQFINHKNKKRDDDRVDNLEWCTGVENERHKQNGKIRGVRYDPDRRKFTAQIKFMKKTYNLGRFDTEQRAIRAYREKYLELHGVLPW